MRLIQGISPVIIFTCAFSAFGDTSGDGNLKGAVLYVLEDEGAYEEFPVIYYYNLGSGIESEVGRLPAALKSHTGLSVSGNGKKIVGCVVKPFDENIGPQVEVYLLERMESGKYELTQTRSFAVPAFPFRSVYDEWDNAVYLTCNEALPLEEKDGNRFGLQDFKLKVTLAIIDLDEDAVADYDITSEGNQTGVISVTEKGIYAAMSKGLGFIKRAKFSSLLDAKYITPYYSTVTFPLISSDERGFVAEGYKKPDEAFSLRYFPFVGAPDADPREVEFAIPKPEKGWGVFYQLTNTVSPYSRHCLFTKHFNDGKGTEKSFYWELLALDTTTWETTSIVKKYGEDYAIHNPPFVFGWIAPEEGTGGNTAYNYVHNNNFIYRPWSLGEG